MDTITHKVSFTRHNGVLGSLARCKSPVRPICQTALKSTSTATSPAAHPTTRLGAWRCHVGLQFNIWLTFHFSLQRRRRRLRANATSRWQSETDGADIDARGRPSTDKMHFSVRPPASHCRSQASLEMTSINSYRKCPKTNFHHVHRSRTMSLYAELEGESPVQKQRWPLNVYRCFDFSYCYCLPTSDLFLIAFSMSLLPSFVPFLTTPSFPLLLLREAFQMKPVGSTDSMLTQRCFGSSPSRNWIWGILRTHPVIMNAISWGYRAKIWGQTPSLQNLDARHPSFCCRDHWSSVSLMQCKVDGHRQNKNLYMFCKK